MTRYHRITANVLSVLLNLTQWCLWM